MASVRPHPFCFPRPSSPSFAVMLFIVMMMAAGCGDDSARSITAPSDAVIQINIAQPFIVANATMQIALVLQRMDSSPVDDGTEVSLSVTAGSLTQQTVQTVNGTATVNYQASSEAGTATLTVRSGGASATIALTVVSAAVRSVAVTAGPTVLPPGGGETDITATVTGTGGTPVVGVPVRFETSAGTAGVTDTTSDSAGVARTTVSTTVAAMVRAIVEGLAPAEVLVRIQAILSVAMAASSTAVTEGDSVTFNIAATSSDGAAATGTLTVDLGDGRSVTVIDFLSTTTVTETYSSAGSYTVTAQLVSDDGSIGTANVALSVAPRPILSVTLSASPTTLQVDETVVFTVGGTSTVGASATGVGAAATGTLVLDYGDGTSTIVGFEDSTTTTKTYSAAGTYTVNAELTATDGRVANATLSLTIDEAPTPTPPPTPPPALGPVGTKSISAR